MRLAIRAGIHRSERKRKDLWEERKTSMQQKAATAPTDAGAQYICGNCKRLLLLDWTVQPRQGL